MTLQGLSTPSTLSTPMLHICMSFGSFASQNGIQGSNSQSDGFLRLGLPVFERYAPLIPFYGYLLVGMVHSHFGPVNSTKRVNIKWGCNH